MSNAEQREVQFFNRAPRCPAIAILGDRVFRVRSPKEVRKLIQREQPASFRRLDSTWECFEYFPDLLIVVPSLSMNRPPTKLQLIELVSLRANGREDSRQFEAKSFSNRSRIQIFNDLIALLDPP